MSPYQNIFKRIEKKYIVDDAVFKALMEKLEGHMQADKYGRTTICNIYFDTPNRQLIRNSLEKPVYKEKLRVRSYGTPDKDGEVFVELKKKFKGVVYKRRVEMTLRQAEDFTSGKGKPGINPQIENEVEYFLKFYKGIAPAMFISYDRIALYGVQDPELRVTFDSRIIYREKELSLDKGVWGTELLPQGVRVMEIKIPNSMPLWLAQILDELKIYPASFSKYGTAYTQELDKRLDKKNNEKKVTDCA